MTDNQSPPTSLKILIIDDEANIRRTMSLCLETEGHSVVAVGSFDDAVAEVSRGYFDLAFVDLRLGTTDGLDLIPLFHTKCPWLKIIVITAYASIDSAVEAMRRGADDYIPKPFTPAQLNIVIRKISEIRCLERRVEELTEDLDKFNPAVDFSSTNSAMRGAIAMARKVAVSDASILLLGESGTGKGLLARSIHSWSRRADKPLGTISCPALSPELLQSELFGHVKGAFTGAVSERRGRIAACEGGTLFLDEIGDLPPSIQPKLLRVMQDREYERVGDQMTFKSDVRFISATNIDLERAVQEGLFRDDLYYRLNVIQIEIPPLRKRTEDIVALAGNFLEFFGRSNHRLFKGFTDEALEALRSHPWPGNVRELRNVIERASILCTSELVGARYLPTSSPIDRSLPAVGDPVTLQRMSELHIRRILETTKTLREAADILGVDQATLWRRRKRYDI